MALLLLFQTVAFGMGILFLTHSHSELKPFLCYPVFYYKQLVHLSTLFTRPLTCVLLLPCLLLQATRPLVNLVHLSTYITTYIFLGIGFLVLYLCIVIRNEGMTNGVLMNQIIYNN